MRAAFLLWIIVFFSTTTYAGSISLHRVEQQALRYSTELKRLHAQCMALRHQAIADGQLNDPTLVLAAMNLPTDTFKIDQEPMTQLQIGIQQQFPKGHSLRYRTMSKQQLANAIEQQYADQKLQILMRVRILWLELVTLEQTDDILKQQKKALGLLRNTTLSMLRSSKAAQHDVLRAELELDYLQDMFIKNDQNIDVARVKLARWLGPIFSRRLVPHVFPRWQLRILEKQVLGRIGAHPKIQYDQALIGAAQANLQWAGSQYVPGFTVGAMYGYRDGDKVDGSPRPDFLSAQVKMDMPVFPANRQSAVVKAKNAELIALIQRRQTDYRDLKERIENTYIAYRKENKRVQLYQHTLIPHTKHYQQALLAAYKNNKASMPDVARSYVKTLNAELNRLKAQLKQHRAYAHLLYLRGR